MTALKIKAINALKSEIANDLVVDYIIDHLIDVHVFTEDEKNTILAIGGDLGSADDLHYRNEVLRRQCELFLRLLTQKISQIDFAYNAFIYILFRDGNYPWIGDKIIKQLSHLERMQNLLVFPGSSHNVDTPSQISSLSPPNSQSQSSQSETTATYALITLSDIKGYDDQINQLKDLIETPLTRGSQLKHTMISWPKTALLYGPMGTGKTSICNALCSEYRHKMFCMYVNCGTILTKKIRDSKENLNSIFKNANQKSPSLVILDNCEIICSKNDNALVAVLGSLLNDLPKNKHIVVILVTNKLDMIDDSLRRSGRIDREIQIKYPNSKEKIKIFKKFLNENTCDITDSQLKEWMISKKRGLQLFTGADIELICKEANWNVAKSVRTKITLEDLQSAFESVFATKKRRHSINVADVLEETPPSRPTTFFRSLSASDRIRHDWTQPNPIVFERSNVSNLNFATPPDDSAKYLALFGPPGSCGTLIDEAQMSETAVNYLSIDLSPENTNDADYGQSLTRMPDIPLLLTCESIESEEQNENYCKSEDEKENNNH